MKKPLTLLAGALLLLTSISEAKYVDLASGRVGRGWDATLILYNTSDTPIQLSQNVFSSLVNSCHDYNTALSLSDMIIPAGQMMSLHGLTTMFSGAQHIHTQFQVPDALDFHTAGLQYYVLIDNAEGELVQILGPGAHSIVPTLGSRRDACPYYGSHNTYGVVGYETELGAHIVTVIQNGPQPNAIAVNTVMTELPAGSGDSYYSIGCSDFQNLAPHQTVISDITNDYVLWSHHASPVISMTNPAGGATWFTYYTDSAGNIYGFEDKKIFEGPGISDDRGGLCLAAIPLSPAAGSTVPPGDVTLSWPPPDPAALSSYGLTTVRGYTILFYTGPNVYTQFDVGCNGNPCTYTLPPGTVSPGTHYSWLLKYHAVDAQGSMPGVHFIPPNNTPSGFSWDSDYLGSDFYTP